MTRLLVVEPGYCPYQAGFPSAMAAASEVVEGESQILKPFGTPRIGLICSKSQSQLKYNRQVNDEGVTVRGRFLVCGLNGDKVIGLSKDQADRYSRLLFLPQVADMASDELPAAKVRPQDERYGTNYLLGKVGKIMEEKTDKVVGYIEYLGAGGIIGEIVPYTGVEKFKDEILDSLDCGRPVTPVVFSDELDEPLQFDSGTYFPWGFRSEKESANSL